MASLLCDGKPMASVEVAEGFEGRLRGLLGRSELEGAFVIHKASSVHTFGMKFAIDVAFCDHNLEVIDTISMLPNRLSLPRRRSRTVIEAMSGAFEQWGLQRHSRLEIRP